MKAGRDLLQDALRALPHGPEFRFVDRLLSLVPGESGVGEYRVREDNFFLRGHLPGEPMLPGVLLVEAAAQLAGVVAQNDPDVPPWPRLKLAALRSVRIMGTARPGETVRLEARITARLGPMVQASASAFIAGAKIMTAELVLSGTPPPGSSLSAGPPPERTDSPPAKW